VFASLPEAVDFVLALSPPTGSMLTAYSTMKLNYRLSIPI
jgi:hypothetical protein